MNKKVNVLLLLSFLFILILGAAYSYSKYNTEASGVASADVANWEITVNGCDVVNPPDKNNTDCFVGELDADGKVLSTVKNFEAGEIGYESNGNQNVVSTKLAPGSSGSFKVTIKPNDTEVSIKYTLDVSILKENSSIKIYRSDPNKNNKIAMETDGYVNYMYYSDDGFYYLDEDNNKQDAEEITFIIYIDWLNDESNNEADTEIGTSGTAPILEVPVNILFEQYIG